MFRPWKCLLCLGFLIVGLIGCGPEQNELTGFASRLESCVDVEPCLHVLTLWSPGMPLSRDARAHVVEAAERLGLPASTLQAESLAQAGAEDGSWLESVRPGLIAAGATVHYPSVVLLDGAQPIGPAIVGYKETETYEQLLTRRLREGPHDRAGSQSATAESAVLAGAGIVWRRTVSPPPGFFFRHVPYSRYISLDQAGSAYLIDRETGAQSEAPGVLDFVPSPDGRLFVTPGEAEEGLRIYSVDEVVAGVRRDDGASVAPLFTDPLMDDQYPSVGLIGNDVNGGTTTYRVIVSWFEGVAMREYRVDWTASPRPQVEPLGSPRDPCPERTLSTPILSKDGGILAARDEATGTTKLFRVDGDTACVELLDLGIATSKVGFSSDSRQVAYSVPQVDGRQSSVWVRDVASDRSFLVPGTDSWSLMIPEFVGADTLLVLVAETANASSREFRIICCTRPD